MELPFTASQLFSDINPKKFDKWALKAFRYQYAANPVYQSFARHLGRTPDTVKSVAQIPFLPISLFKSHRVVCGDQAPAMTFTSSGTTGQITSQHHVLDLDWYEQSFRLGFSIFYGHIQNYAVLALLPSYLERKGSSLVYMAEKLIADSKHPDSGFYLYNYDELIQTINRLEAEGQQVLLLGVTHALLDLADKGPFEWKNTLVMETGGMKGRRREMIREELHAFLQQGLGVARIHSEYGMTELLSQAYSMGEGLFETPPWMQVQLRDPEDPLSPAGLGKQGGINVIDLANLHSCCFIATQDLGRLHPNGQFEVLGRFDHADLRGCNLMVAYST